MNSFFKAFDGACNLQDRADLDDCVLTLELYANMAGVPLDMGAVGPAVKAANFRLL